MSVRIARDAEVPHRVAIVGSGFAGLNAAKALRRKNVEVTVIDRTNQHLFQPLLYQLATGILSEGDIAPPIRDILRHQRNATVVLGEVDEVDLETRQLIVNTPTEPTVIDYDSLIVAAGAGHSYFGHPEFAPHAPGMETVEQALALRSRIFGALEVAERASSPEVRRAWLTFVVVGAGPTGVELAGQIAELSHRSLHDNFRQIDPAEARVVLLDAAPGILPSYPDVLQTRATRHLKRIGVEIHVGALVTGVDASGIDISSAGASVTRIGSATKVWAAGVEASSLGRAIAGAAGVAVDRAGRVVVEADCSVAGYPEVFVVGDLMALDDLPGLAQVAIQSGRHVARTIAGRLNGDSAPKPFHYRDKGSTATVWRFCAVAEIGRLKLSGFVGWVLWLTVHLVAMTGFKNRVAVAFNWTVAFLGRGRPQRAITARAIARRES